MHAFRSHLYYEAGSTTSLYSQYTQTHHRYMAEILPIWHKTLFNQSINRQTHIKGHAHPLPSVSADDIME